MLLTCQCRKSSGERERESEGKPKRGETGEKEIQLTDTTYSGTRGDFCQLRHSMCHPLMLSMVVVIVVASSSSSNQIINDDGK